MARWGNRCHVDSQNQTGNLPITRLWLHQSGKKPQQSGNPVSWIYNQSTQRKSIHMKNTECSGAYPKFAYSPCVCWYPLGVSVSCPSLKTCSQVNRCMYVLVFQPSNRPSISYTIPGLRGWWGTGWYNCPHWMPWLESLSELRCVCWNSLWALRSSRPTEPQDPQPSHRLSRYAAPCDGGVQVTGEPAASFPDALW